MGIREERRQRWAGRLLPSPSWRWGQPWYQWDCGGKSKRSVSRGETLVGTVIVRVWQRKAHWCWDLTAHDPSKLSLLWTISRCALLWVRPCLWSFINLISFYSHTNSKRNYYSSLQRGTWGLQTLSSSLKAMQLKALRPEPMFVQLYGSYPHDCFPCVTAWRNRSSLLFPANPYLNALYTWYLSLLPSVYSVTSHIWFLIFECNICDT